jgi:hypothetical protein
MELTRAWDFYPGMLVRMKSDNKLIRVTSPKQKWIHGEDETGKGWRFLPVHVQRAEDGAEFESAHGEDLTCFLGDTVRFKAGTRLRGTEGAKVFVVMGFSQDGVKLAELNGHSNRYYRSVPRNQVEATEV